MYISPSSCHLINLGPKILINTLFSDVLKLRSSIYVTHFYTHTQQQVKLYKHTILINNILTRYWFRMRVYISKYILESDMRYED
jgi:hypothetical protein